MLDNVALVPENAPLAENEEAVTVPLTSRAVTGVFPIPTLPFANILILSVLFVAIESRIGVRDLDNLGGITQKTPVLTVLFAILLLGSVALPLTNGFIGEFMLLLGVFKYNNWFGVVAGTTIILGAAYMLRMFQGTMFGTQTNYTKNMTDLNMTEKLALLPLIVMVFWIGLYPATFIEVIEPSVQQLIMILK